MVELALVTEPITLSLVVGSAAVFLLMALRSRSFASLQVQLSLAMLVWAGSEVPHILGTLGFIDIEAALQEIGLQFHLLSMFILAGFIALRTSKMLGVVSVKEGVERAAYQGIKTVLGESGAAAVKFYLDLSQARKKPAQFVAGLRKAFAAGSGFSIEWISQVDYEKAIVLLQEDFTSKVMAAPGTRGFRAVSVIAEIEKSISEELVASGLAKLDGSEPKDLTNLLLSVQRGAGTTRVSG